jgi:hypothetical protein
LVQQLCVGFGQSNRARKLERRVGLCGSGDREK